MLAGVAEVREAPDRREELSQLSLIRDYYFRFQVLVHEVAKFGVVGLAGFVVQLGVQNALRYGAGVGPTISLTSRTPPPRW